MLTRGGAFHAVRLGEESGDHELVLTARSGRLISIDEVDAELALIERLAQDPRWNLRRWGNALFRAVRALVDGRFDDAELLAQQALSIAHEVNQETAVVAFGAQLLLLRREQNRASEMEAAAKSFMSDFSGAPAYRCVLALLYAELGREAECREEFERLASEDFAVLAPDYWWTISLALLTEVAIYLGDFARASRLYKLLLPYEGRTIIVPQTAVVLFLCYGTVSRHRALLASGTGCVDDALRHSEDALRLSMGMGARPWVAHTQRDCAKMLLSRGAPGDGEKALELLEECLDTANELGMKALAEKAAALKVQAEANDRPSS